MNRMQPCEASALTTRHYVLSGLTFEVSMAIVWIVRCIQSVPDWSLVWDFTFNFSALGIGDAMTWGGFLIILVAMLRIYLQQKHRRRLITTDIFAITRHPMYHGMFLADLAHFFKGADLQSPYWWLTSILFWILLLTAGWYQEKETLSRWGTEAERYYARTPRFIFEWLWFWKIRAGRIA